MKGFTMVERGHVILTTPPAASANAIMSGAVISMKNWAHATIIALKGVSSANTTVTLKECSSFAGSDQTLIGFRYQQVNVAGSDTGGAAALAWVGTGGVAFSGSSSGYIAIEVDADELSDGKPFLVPQISAGQVPLAALVILSGGRFQKDITATALS